MEFRRVFSLPRRPVGIEPNLVAEMTEMLRSPWGKETLFPVQAAALRDIYEQGGALCPIPVGRGKTLISYLTPVMLEAQRPLLIVPAGLITKTRREFRKLHHDWAGPLPEAYRIESYELLGRVSGADMLDSYQPDVIVMDECHRVKNPRAAVTRRIRRYLAEHRTTRVVAMSGTIINKALRDFAHIAQWCLPGGSPVPATYQDLDAWALALDADVEGKRPDPGALLLLCNELELQEARYGDTTKALRRAFGRRLVETPGVVVAQDTAFDQSLGSLRIAPIFAEPDKTVDEHFETLRTKWERPDGHAFADAPLQYQHARQMAMGFFYRYNPHPPDWWLERRREWASWCRQTLKGNRRGLDSEKQVCDAIDAGDYPEAADLLAKWRDAQERFTPEQETVFFSDCGIDAVRKWVKALGDEPGIVFVEAIEFGRAVAKALGLEYYQDGGLSDKGAYIEDHDTAKGPLVATIGANKDGKNLQYKWARALVVGFPSTHIGAEQLLGRMHRPGQPKDEVRYDVYLGCIEHVAGFEKATSRTACAEDLTTQIKKISIADVTVPPESELYLHLGKHGKSFRWRRD